MLPNGAVSQRASSVAGNHALRAYVPSHQLRPRFNAQPGCGGRARASVVARLSGGDSKPVASKPAEVVPLAGGGSGNGVYGNNNGGGGGGDGNSSSGGRPQQPPPELAAILAAAGRTADSFPADFANAMFNGKVTPEILTRWLEMESNWFLKLFWGFEGCRERLLADPSFLVKVAIEVCIGVCTKLTAEYAKRQENFQKEIDFVCANVMMAIIADWMLVYLPAPTLSYATRKVTTNPLLSMFAGCPDNAFQKVQPGMAPFTVGQRFKAVVRNGLKLFGVGSVASLFGVAVTNTIIYLRSALDPTFSSPNKPQNVAFMSAAYGTYMATSSNLRYQLLAGVIEERGIETIFKGNHAVCNSLSLVVRTLNTFLGSLLWVDFIRLLGGQKSS